MKSIQKEVIDYLDKNKEDMEFYEFLVNTFDEEKRIKIILLILN